MVESLYRAPKSVQIMVDRCLDLPIESSLFVDLADSGVTQRVMT